MLINPFIGKFYAADGTEAGADTTTDTSQGTAQDDATHQGDDGQGDGKEEGVAEGKKEGQEKLPEDEENELVIEGLEELEDGRIQYTVGNSVYISKEGLKGNRAVSDVLKQEREAVAKKDEAYQQMKQRSSKEKAAAAISLPKNLEEDAEKPPTVPPIDEIVASTLKRHNLQPGMDKWGRAQWLEYQDKNELRDWEIGDLRRSVETAVAEAQKAGEAYFRQYNNFSALKEAETSVRDMLSEIDGVEPNDYAEEFVNVVRRARKDGLNSFGEISATWILKEMGKVVGKTLNSRQKSQLQSQIEKEIAENKNRRSGPKPVVTTGARLKPSGKEVKSIADATRLVMEEERKRGNV